MGKNLKDYNIIYMESNPVQFTFKVQATHIFHFGKTIVNWKKKYFTFLLSLYKYDVYG